MTGLRVFTALLACCAWAQDNVTYRVDTIAGLIPNQDGIPAVEAFLFLPQAIAVAGDGVIYVADALLGIRAINGDGTISNVKPSIPPTFAIAADASGFLYSVQGPELYVRTPTGDTHTYRPLSYMPTSATLTSVVVGLDGTPVIADIRNRVVARVNKAGSAEVIAGSVSPTLLPNRLAIDAKGNTYIATPSQIFRLMTDGSLSLLAGSGEYGKPLIGSPASGSPFTQIGAKACGSAGEIYVVDGRSVLAINAEGVIDRVVWEGNATDLAVETSGTLLVLDRGGLLVRVDNDGAKTIVAGRIPFGGDGGPSTEALLNLPRAVAPDFHGGYFIANTGNNRIRRVSPTGTITTVAGTGVPGFSGDGGPGAEAQLAGPSVLTTDGEGNVYFAAQSYLKVRRLRPDGIVETVAGTGNYGDSGDGGPAVDATFRSIDGLAVDQFGALYISDRLSNRVRVVKSGAIFPYAGTGEGRSFGGDGPATSTPLVAPTLLTVEASGDLVILEIFRFRKVSSTSGTMTTLSLISPLGIPGDVSAENLCTFNAVSGISSDSEGNLLVAGNSRVCRYGKDGISWAIAGSRNPGFAGDGASALDALFGTQIGLAVDPSGSVLLADTHNNRIRRLTK